MKQTRIQLFFLLCLIAITFSKAQEIENFNYNVKLGAGLSSETTLPFWLEANRYGSVPNTDHLLLNATIFSDFKKPEKDFGIAYKFSATGFIANEIGTTTSYVADENQFLINELYLRFQYKNWALDIGNRNDAIKWNGLSSSNGNIVKSLNARAIPGINLKTLEYLKLPFAQNWLRFQFNFSNYFLNDNRYVDNAMLHNAGLYFKFITSSKLSIEAGINHYAQWGGTSPTTGKQPSTFKDFIRIVLGKSGGSSSLETDQLNALGNHLGSYLLQLNHTGEQLNWNFYYSHPFEDRSGMELQNWRDALYGINIDFKKNTNFIKNLLFEVTYTKHMSGKELPDRVDENGNKLPGRGHDNYFNNGVYNSGWTYFGNTIGTPYITPKTIDEDGLTKGVIIGDNRLMAFNIGVGGVIKSINYRALLSHTAYFGWFDNEYETKPKQFSGLFEFVLPQATYNIPFDISLSASFDTGTYRPVNFGGFLTITRRGKF